MQLLLEHSEERLIAFFVFFLCLPVFVILPIAADIWLYINRRAREYMKELQGIKKKLHSDQTLSNLIWKQLIPREVVYK